jgi:hypothetical protein
MKLLCIAEVFPACTYWPSERCVRNHGLERYGCSSPFYRSKVKRLRFKLIGTKIMKLHVSLKSTKHKEATEWSSMSEHYAFVMMTKEKYWLLFRERELEGKKTQSFVLKGAAPPKATRILLFYVSNPVKAIDG